MTRKRRSTNAARGKRASKGPGRGAARSAAAGGGAPGSVALTTEQVRALVHELEVHRIELETQNAELIRTQQTVQESEQRYRNLYEFAPIAYLTVDREGRIVSANPAAGMLMGSDATRLVRQKLSAFVTPRDQDVLHRERFALVQHGTRRSFTLEMERPDCTVVELQVIASLEPRPQGSPMCLHLALLDLTELRRAERALRDVVSQAVLTEQEERRKLAADLHDEAGQLLALATLKLRALHTSAGASCELELGQITELLAEAHQRISSLSFQLSPPLLYDVGLEAAVQWLAEDLGRRYGLVVRLSSEGDLREALDDTTRVLLFRALRELLVNVAKHARASEALVRILREGERVCLEVHDQGVGFDPEASPRGFGLLSLRERVRHLGGSIEIHSRIGRGTRITIQVPFGASASREAGGAP